MNQAVVNSHKTAIVRHNLSRPIRSLQREGLIKGNVLDFGCGRGYDADTLGFSKYDPHFFPTMPEGKFDVVVCNFVVNTLPKESEETLFTEILSKVVDGGKAFVSVRRDVEVEGFTTKGTYQRNVFLPFKLITENSEFAIYELTA